MSRTKTQRFAPGYVVCSRQGRDKGTLYLILCRKGRFVELADGIKRTAAAPKKKNVLHLHLVSKKMPGFESGLPGDEEIARFLRSLDKAETDSKHL